MTGFLPPIRCFTCGQVVDYECDHSQLLFCCVRIRLGYPGDGN